MNLINNYLENVNFDLKVSYDRYHDILRMSNYNSSDISMEEINSRVVVVVEECKQEVIGFEIYDSLNYSEENYQALKSAGLNFMATAYKHIIESYKIL